MHALAPPDAAALVATTVSPAVADRLAVATGGNPLAMLEVSATLTAAQRAGAAALPDPLPAGERLHTVYDAALAGLTSEARHAVLLVALSRTGGGFVADTLALDRAVTAGVLVADPQGHRFQHPLLRAAVLRLATPEEQRSAHRSLAAGLPRGAPGRAHHLAAASTGPDDVLAEELDRVAAGDRIRFGYAASSLALERAAALTGDPAAASARLAAAADDAFVAGDVARTRRLVGRLLSSTSASDPARGRALFTLGMVEQYAGSEPPCGAAPARSQPDPDRCRARRRAHRARTGPVPARGHGRVRGLRSPHPGRSGPQRSGAARPGVLHHRRHVGSRRRLPGGPAPADGGGRAGAVGRAGGRPALDPAARPGRRFHGYGRRGARARGSPGRGRPASRGDRHAHADPRDQRVRTVHAG